MKNFLRRLNKLFLTYIYRVSQKKNGTQVNGYNFVTADSKYLKLCRHKVNILNDKHAKKSSKSNEKNVFYKVPHFNHDFRKTCSKCLPPRWMHTSQKNGTQVNGYNFVTVDLIYLKLCRYKDKILNDKHGKN